MQLTRVFPSIRKNLLLLAALATTMLAGACTKDVNCHHVYTPITPAMQPIADTIPEGIDTAEYLRMMDYLSNLARNEVANRDASVVCD